MTEMFRYSGLVILLFFVILISDFRIKGDIKPLVDVRIMLLLKAIYLIPLGSFFYILLSVDNVNIFDLIAFVKCFSGTFLVFFAKKALGRYHTWTGYCMTNSKLVTYGIYRYIRHPLYLGIYFFIIGGSLIVIPRIGHNLAFIVFLSIIFISLSIGYISKKETEYLYSRFGKDFERYKTTTNAYIPKQICFC